MKKTIRTACFAAFAAAMLLPLATAGDAYAGSCKAGYEYDDDAGKCIRKKRGS